MRIEQLASEEQRSSYTQRIILTHEDITESAANTAQTIAIMTVLAGQALLGAALKLVTPFKDASDNAFNSTTIKVGDGIDDDRAINSQQANENGTEVLYGVNDPAKLPYVYLADDTIDIIFGSMAAKALSDIDVGEVHILLAIADVTKVA